MDLAQAYGRKLYTGVFYRNPDPPPTYEQLAQKLQESSRATARPRERILDLFLQKPGKPASDGGTA
jgi:2-oxoglutarate ferredoxin oxidoreductase subunit beta